MGMWGAIGKGLATVGKGVAKGAKFVGKNIGMLNGINSASGNDIVGWLSPMYRIIKHFKNKKGEGGVHKTTAGPAQNPSGSGANPHGGETKPATLPAAPSTGTPTRPRIIADPNKPPAGGVAATAEEKATPKISVSFDEPQSSYTPVPMSMDGAQMLELNPYRMNRQRFLRGKPVNDDRG